MKVEVITPRDDRQWHKLRGQDVTASVAGALFGVHPFTTLASLWAEKSKLLPPRLDQDSPAMMRGRYLEPVAVQILRDRHPEWTVEHNAAENRYYRSPEHRIGATPDVIVDCPTRGLGIIQIKSVAEDAYRAKWCTEDAVEPPLWIAIQASIEAKLVGASWAAVAPLVVGFGLTMPELEVELHDGLWANITKRTAAFWKGVEDGTRPELDLIADAETVDAIYRHGDDEEVADLTQDGEILELIGQRHDAVAAAKEAAANKLRAETAIKAKLGHATLAILAGGRRATWRRQKTAHGHSRVLRLPKMEN